MTDFKFPIPSYYRVKVDYLDGNPPKYEVLATYNKKKEKKQIEALPEFDGWVAYDDEIGY